MRVIAQDGTPRDLYDAPANAFVADFIGEANILPCEIAAGRGRHGRGEAWPYRSQTAVTGPERWSRSTGSEAEPPGDRITRHAKRVACDDFESDLRGQRYGVYRGNADTPRFRGFPRGRRATTGWRNRGFDVFAVRYCLDQKLDSPGR